MGHFRASCSLGSLSGIRSFVREELGKLRVPETLMNELVLAVDEACANNIIHQHQCNENDGFDLFIHHENGNLIVEIEDVGEPFRIDQYNPKDIEQIISDRRQGGLGIYLITRIMDKVEVESRNGKSVYRFLKRI